jgi:hypothetical protein
MLGSKTLILTSTYPVELSASSTAQHRFRRRVVTVLHIIGLVASLIAICLFSAAIPTWNRNFFHTKGPNSGDWTDGMPLGPLLFAFLYHATVLVQGQVRKTRNATSTLSSSLSRPSLIIHLAVPCLLLLSLLPALLLATYGSLFRFWRPAVRSQSGLLICNTLNIFARECEPTLYDIGSLQIAGITFGTLVWITHFALFLAGLRNWRRARLARQLQQEKMAQYASPYVHDERRSARASRRDPGSLRGPVNPETAASADQDAWRQHVPSDRYRRSGPSSTSSANSKPRTAPRSSGSGSKSIKGRLLRGKVDKAGATHQTVQDAAPIFFIQAPEASHPPITTRQK